MGFKNKTPSIVAYNTDPPRWGAQVRTNDKPQASHFKLDLEPSARHESSTEQRHQIPRRRLADLKPVDITTDYLTCVYTYLRDVFFRQRFGENHLQHWPTSFVITVPAMWSDFAQNLTRMAAVRAGIPDDKLCLVTEPEAAALYCATICEEVDLGPCDRFLVCTAGGGIIVFTSLSNSLLMDRTWLAMKYWI
jgi:molecular chaperone DnaK (HSP70)